MNGDDSALAQYSETLRATLVRERRGALRRDLPGLVADVLAARTAVREAPLGGLEGSAGPDRASAFVAYDASLVRLCHELGIDQYLTMASPPPDARADAEDRLAGRLRALLDFLEAGPVGTAATGRGAPSDRR